MDVIVSIIFAISGVIFQRRWRHIGVLIIGVISGRGTGSSGGRGGDSGGSGAAMAWKWNYVIYDFFFVFLEKA